MVIGALGRCGRGAVEMAHKMGIPKYANLFTLIQLIKFHFEVILV